MNIPDIYIIEPYNPYAPKGGRKKSVAEIMEEQELISRLIAEANSVNKNNNTIQNNNSIAHTATAVAAASAGAGGSPPYQYFNPTMAVNFSMSATTASAPVNITFTNLCHNDLQLLGAAAFSWSFGDGTNTVDNVNQNPIHKYTTTGSNFSVSLTARSTFQNLTASATLPLNITAPTVTASFTVTSASLSGSAITASHPAVISFKNATTTNNAQNSINYFWNFGSGSNPTSSLTNPTFTYSVAGTYTVVLQATGSFGITSSKSLVAVNVT